MAGVRLQRGGAGGAGARDRARRLHAGRGRGDLARHRRLRVRRRGGRYRLALETRELDRDGMVEMLLGWVERYPIVSIEDPLGRGRSRRLRARSPARSANACRSSATIPGHQRRAGRAPRRARRVQRGADQAQPGRHAHRDQGRAGRGAARRGCGTHRLGALGRDRGRRPSPTSPSAGTRASSRSARSPAPSAWRSGTRRCASRRRSGAARASPARGVALGTLGKNVLFHYAAGAEVPRALWRNRRALAIAPVASATTRRLSRDRRGRCAVARAEAGARRR